MPRNSAGVYTVPNTFTPNTVISSSQVNTNFTDSGQALTDSLDRTGRGGMLAALDFGGFRGINAAQPTAGTDVVTRDWWATPTVPMTTLTVSGAVTFNGPLTTDNTTADEVGFKGVPIVTQNGNYTLSLSDAGKTIYKDGGPGITINIPSNASVPFPVGTAITIINNTADNALLSITTDVLVLAGTSMSGTRTLGINAVVTIIKITPTAWIVTGTGLS